MAHRDSPFDSTEESKDDGVTLTRRTALALLGVGGIGAAMSGSAGASSAGGVTGQGADARPWNQDVDAQGYGLSDLGTLEVDHVHTAARDADVLVWKDEDGVFHADNREETVASGEDVIDVTQAAVDSLTEGRTVKEKVAVVSSGTAGPHEWDGDVHAIDLPSYTILDVPATIQVEDEGDPLVVPVRTDGAEHVEVPRLSITGNPRYGMWIRSSSNVTLGEIDIRMDPGTNEVGLGVRIDAFGESEARCKDVRVGRVYVEHADNHALETYGVDRLQVDEVMAKHHEYCACLLNDTHAGVVGSVVGYNPEAESRYATFRVANAVENVSCGQVVSTEAPRGVHISDGRDITIGTVNITDSRTLGIAADSTVENAVVQGGLIKNCAQEGIRSDTDGFSVTNVRVYDDRREDEREQPIGIRIAGPNSRVVDCDVRRGGTDDWLDIAADDAVVRDNVGDGLDSGTVTLESVAEPAARVEGVSENPSATLDLRASAVEAPAGSCGWDHRFEWDGDAERWDLLLEWTVDPGADLDLEYVVDQPQANISGGVVLERPLEAGTYRIDAVHSGLALTAESDGNVVQDEWNDEATQQWDVERVDADDDVYRLAADGSVLEVEGASTDNGANVRVGADEGGDHQRFVVRHVGDEEYSVEALHSGQGINVEGERTDPGENVLQWPYGGAPNERWTFERL
ncbi:RICIN domain-containing protein [Halomontanus rarus]|uniref:RICIN domain-containing protein n=1 Tax=Halomontanus rarus TaxID=3034020 RepID=UPI0023E75544|nr:RICIN domain-containing protein [Halovivax sp. TS33]